MKKNTALLLALVVLMGLTTTALAYPDGSDSAYKKNLPYSSNFAITKSTKTNYWFTPGGSDLTLDLTNIKLSSNKDCTLKCNSYYYTSGGQWASGSSGSVSLKSGKADDKNFDWSCVSGRKYCGGFSKSDYTSLTVSADFTFDD